MFVNVFLHAWFKISQIILLIILNALKVNFADNFVWKGYIFLSVIWLPRSLQAIMEGNVSRP